mgnify:CR=1 FL=1
MSLFKKIKKGLEESIAFERGEGEARVTYACSPRDDRFAVIITPPQKGDRYYNVYIPDLDINTEGKDFYDALYMAKDAVELLGVCRAAPGHDDVMPLRDPDAAPGLAGGKREERYRGARRGIAYFRVAAYVAEQYNLVD